MMPPIDQMAAAATRNQARILRLVHKNPGLRADEIASFTETRNTAISSTICQGNRVWRLLGWEVTGGKRGYRIKRYLNGAKQ